MKTVKVDVTNVDDGVTVYKNGNKMLHVHYMHEGSTQFDANNGDTVKFIIENLTGRDWHANIKMKISGKVKMDKKLSGWSVIGQREAWAKEIVI